MITANNKNRGFTLVELMVAMAISTVVLAGIYTAYHSQVRSYTKQKVVVEMQQNIRNAMFFMQGSIRSAGFDPQGMGTMGFVTNFEAPYDTLGATTDANNMAFTVDADEDGTLDLNSSEHIAFRLNNGLLQKLFIDPGSGAASWETVAENIDALDYVYLDGDNPQNVLNPALPDDLAAIESVQVTVVARAGENPSVMTDSRPDNKNYENQQGTVIFSPGGDSFSRNHMSIHVNCRNLSL